MSSPFIPCPISYNDAPEGGVLMPMVITGRNPSNTIDKQYQSGYLWLSSLDVRNSDNTTGSGNFYVQAGNSAGSPNWAFLGASSGDLNTLTGTSGGAIPPSAGNINILGTANQIVFTGSGSTLTASFVGPYTPATYTTHGVLVGAGTSSIVALSVGSTGTLLAGTTGADPAFTGSPSVSGSLTAGTTITATLGAITATNGNIVRGTAGNKDVYSSVASTTTAGANSAGTVTLVGGTATIATTAVTASSQIRLYRQGIGSTGAAALGIITRGTVSAGVSFIINAVQAADATALQTTDVSSIGWEIVN